MDVGASGGFALEPEEPGAMDKPPPLSFKETLPSSSPKSPTASALAPTSSAAVAVAVPIQQPRSNPFFTFLFIARILLAAFCFLASLECVYLLAVYVLNVSHAEAQSMYFGAFLLGHVLIASSMRSYSSISSSSSSSASSTSVNDSSISASASDAMIPFCSCGSSSSHTISFNFQNPFLNLWLCAVIILGVVMFAVPGLRDALQISSSFSPPAYALMICAPILFTLLHFLLKPLVIAADS